MTSDYKLAKKLKAEMRGVVQKAVETAQSPEATVPEVIIPVPNMSEKECWEMMQNDLKNLFAKHKLDGLIVDVKNLFPVPFKRDYLELRRLNNNEHVHSLEVRMKGNLVLQNPVPHASSQVGSNQNAFLNFFRKIVPWERDILFLADLHNVRNTDNQNIARIKSVVKSCYIPKVTFPQVLPRH